MNDKAEINALDGSNATTGDGTISSPPALSLSSSLDEGWLHDFYKECGREVTLAYTTLNQMKNWAMVIAAAAVSGLSFGSKSPEYPTPIMFAGSVIVYTFILRFFVRAIICYINLVRWNRLQTDCVEAKLLPNRRTSKTSQELMEKLRDDLQHYYFEWLSPISRKEQIFQNLKLGFYLLFGLSLFFLTWGAVVLWQQYLVKGLTTFAFLNTGLEATDFYRSRYFDDLRASERRKAGKHHQVLPVPASSGGFMAGWVFNIAVSTIVATSAAHIRGLIAALVQIDRTTTLAACIKSFNTNIASSTYQQFTFYP